MKCVFIPLMTLKLGNKGQGLTEYLVLLLLVAVISIGAVKALGNTVKSKLKEAQTQINHVSAYQNSGDN